MLMLFEAEKKLLMADYLIGLGPGFHSGAINHIVDAANILVAEYLHLGVSSVSPILAGKKLAEVEETKSFAVSYGVFWKFPITKNASYDDVVNAYKATKSFLGLVKRTRGPA